MTVHKVTARRAKAAPTLSYIYRGEGHEHDVNLIKHIGGNVFTQDPIERNKFGLPENIDVSELAKEFEEQADLHKSKGRKLFKHYIISLAPGEQLEPHQWFEHINSDYLPALGYDNSCKWIACQHDDKEHSHVHIFTCMVKGDGELVKTQNDVMLGFDSIRRLENKYNLQKLESPDQNWGKHFSKGELKHYGSRKEAESSDWGAIIRARFNQIQTENGGKLPNTMTKLVLALANKGIEVKARLDDEGKIIGLSFKADDGAWLAASRIKKSRLTFPNLQRKEGVSYVPERDNAAFGIGNNELKLSISVDITEVQFAKIKVFKAKVKVRKRSNAKLSAGFTFCSSKQAYQIMIMSQTIMELLKALFGSDKQFKWEQKEHNDYLYQNSVDYNLVEKEETFNQLKADHKNWIDGGGGGGGETELC
ncbi:relaxase/mobilization nuclease domain-containing protein [Colwellia sp. MB02u-14]|uniref:relaxase/mobilization nuclease domain-containing protein n=1 Tax=Colwellia sp. MB02u-14 TaxID=2759815 RepID=UPI0015F537A6|nr:relaxase/mobilization nuclease domain-containing protein [Colwellia sp. MB02u-14]MBA6303469.1 relaxase/mobilization nuclease domain-containing protein [Colwellia sp. MB02u-14]